MHVLLLGGTAEARELAGAAAIRWPQLAVTTSLAGRVERPRLPAGQVRTGGFGGPDGMARWLRDHRVDVLIDATHPFADAISAHAAQAAAAHHVPLLHVRRPGWVPVGGDDWRPVPSLADAAETAPRLGSRIFLSVGRGGTAAFVHLHCPWFLVRAVHAPAPPLPPRSTYLPDRGPFTLDGERELLRRHRIDVLVTKDSGGTATVAKLTAAREAGLPVVLVRRPPAPHGVPVTQDVPGALSWLAGHVARR